MRISQLYNIFQEYPRICTDTRTIEKDCLFFALKGPSFNGNEFAEQALAEGAKYVVIDEHKFNRDDARYICVPDVLTTLQELARFHRDQLTIPVIGITGTNGKTTTKELLLSVLSQKFKTLATRGNLNNHIGVPLSLLSLPKEAEIAIIEMGANHLHEIKQLCEIAKPTHGLITNVGKAHLEGFGSYEGVKQTKSELYAYLQEHQGVVFIQGDNPELLELAERKHIRNPITYGTSSKNTVQGAIIQTAPLIRIYWQSIDSVEQQEVQTQLTGTYNLENMLSAVSVGLHFGLSATQVNQGLINYVPTNNRSQIVQTDKNQIIADFYNANASSMSAALDNLSHIGSGRKAVILGDMFEMGEDSKMEHEILRDKAIKLQFDKLIFVGPTFYEIRDDRGAYFETVDHLIEELEQHPITEHTVLLKASRGMAFESILSVL